MPRAHSDRYEKAPVEGEYYDPKGYLLLKQFRKFAKITTYLMALMLVVTMIRAISEGAPGPFFIVFFSFVIILGFVGITYDHKLDEHKDKVFNAKKREQLMLQKSVIASKNLLDDAYEGSYYGSEKTFS